MKRGDLVRINTHNKPYLLPELDIRYDSHTPVLQFGEIGIILEPERNGKIYLRMCKVATRFGVGWISRVFLEVISEKTR